MEKRPDAPGCSRLWTGVRLVGVLLSAAPVVGLLTMRRLRRRRRGVLPSAKTNDDKRRLLHVWT